MTKVYRYEGIVPAVDPTSFVHPTAVLIGDVIIGPGCYIGPLASLRGDMGRIVMEGGSNLQDGCVIHGFFGGDTRVGVDGHIGHGAVLHGCTIERNALVGMNAVVMDQAVVGESAFVAAMAFVKAGFVVPPRSLAAGLPAKIVRALTDDEIAWKAAGTRDYHHLAVRSLATLEACDALSAPEEDRPRLTHSITAPLHLTRARNASTRAD